MTASKKLSFSHSIPYFVLLEFVEEFKIERIRSIFVVNKRQKNDQTVYKNDRFSMGFNFRYFTKRKRGLDLREVFNPILYILRTGIQSQNLPNE